MLRGEMLTEGDLDRGGPPDLKSPHWRCSVIDPATGAVCTRRPHLDSEDHKGIERIPGTLRETRTITWCGGTERAMVIDGYTWTRIPGAEVEIRALTERPLALRLRRQGSGPNAPSP